MDDRETVRVEGGGDYAIVAVGLISIGGGLGLVRGTASFLSRHLGGWVAITGVVVLIFFFLEWLPPDSYASRLLATVDGKLIGDSCGSLEYSPKRTETICVACAASMIDTFQECRSKYDAIYLVGLRLLGIMILLWMLVLLAACVTVIGAWSRRRTEQENGPKSLLAPAISLMAVSWVLFLAGIWGAIANLGWRLLPHEQHLTYAMRGLPGALLAAVLLGFVAFLVGMRKRALRRLKPKKDAYLEPNEDDYLKQPDFIANKHRLIVSQFLIWVLGAFLVLATASSVMHNAQLWLGVGLVADTSSWLLFMDRWTPAAIAVSAGLGAIAVSSFAGQMAAGLGIVFDVLTYLNDYSWDSREPIRSIAGKDKIKGDATRTFVERLLPLLASREPEDGKRGYWLRRRIKDRMKVLVAQLIRDERPDELAIVSHSQGTVLAMDVIDEMASTWLQSMPSKASIRLVTMGSPYRHLHHHYFPSSFPNHVTRANLRGRKDGGLLTDWINIFRVDDFVGTHIDPHAKWPREHPVPANGHTLYWVDENVHGILRDFLRFGSNIRGAES